MTWKHWLGLALLFVVGYVVGKNFSLPLIPTFKGMGGGTPVA